MRKNLSTFIYTFLGLVILQSCENDLMVNAEWEETTIVYAAINPTDDSNFVRIQRGFLNQGGDALQFAKDPDSIYFDSLDVKLAEYVGGVERAVYNLVKVDGNAINRQKDSGIFNNERNDLYLCTNKLRESNFSTQVQYKLVIFNKVTGNIVTSQTTMLGPSQVRNPVNEVFKGISILDKDPGTLIVEYLTGPQAYSYDIQFLFRYKEAPRDDTSSWDIKEVLWTPIRGRETGSTRGFVEKSAAAQGHLFYKYIADVIPEKPDYVRKAVDMELNVIGGNEDLFTYIDVSKPSISIIQKRPEYTNIENGLGIFSARHIRRYQDLVITGVMHASIVNSPTIAHLNFQ